MKKSDPYLSSAETLKSILPFLPVKMALTDTKFEIITVTKKWLHDPHLIDFEQSLKKVDEKEGASSRHSLLASMARRALAGQILKDDCMKWPLNDDETRWIKVEMQPWLLSKERPGGVLIFIKDLTEQKHQEQQLKDLECLAYMCPHDLKSSMRIMNSFLTLLYQHRKNEWDGTEEKYFDFIFKALRNINEIIEHTLSTLQPILDVEGMQPVNLYDVVTSVIQSIQPLIEEKKAKISLKNLPTVQGDTIPLKRVFLNLITNALKYSDQPIIEIYGEQTALYHQVSIKDNGIGIDQDLISTIFETYTKGDSEHDGSGLGLSYCLKVVRMLKGDIAVESTVGLGSTFILKFPLT